MDSSNRHSEVSVQLGQEPIRVRGKTVHLDSIKIDDLEIIIKGKYLRIAMLKEEWDQDVNDPKFIVASLRKSSIQVDLFTFVQRLPESRPKYNYFNEWDSVAAIPIKNYDYWIKHQIPDQVRNKIKKAIKTGIEIRPMAFNDEMVKGISNIYNDAPMRQGVPMSHFNMPMDLVRKLNGTFIDRSEFFGAFYKEELIGYLKIAHTDRFARVMGILSKPRHNGKAPMNLLLAKAVEVCAMKNVPYFVYAKYEYGKVGSATLKDFKKSNGFESILIPRYYIPLTRRGKVALRFGLYKQVKDMLPKAVVRFLLAVRMNLYSFKASLQSNLGK